jgi:hypothetical protein
VRSALLLAALSATAAAQEPSFEALGQAPISGGDRVRARDRALDEAFRQAVEQAVATILEPKVIAERAAQLKLSVYPKARTFIATWRILEEGDQGALFQVRIEAQVAVARLAREVQAPQAVTPSKAPAPRAWACLSQRTSAGPFAASASEARLAQALSSRGIEVVAGAGDCAPYAAGSDAPDDAKGSARASASAAQGAVIGALTVEPLGLVRGTPLALAHARATVHLVEAGGRRSAAVTGEGDAYAASPAAAGDDAAHAALDDALRALGPALGARWPAPGAGGPGLTVLVLGATRWIEYQALLRALASIGGVGAVVPRRFDATGFELTVRTATSAAGIAAAFTHLPPDRDGVRFSVEPEGDLALRVRVTSPEPTPPTQVAPPG